MHSTTVALEYNTRWPKKIGTLFSYALTLPNINRFSKLFHCQNQEKICNNAITKDPNLSEQIEDSRRKR